MYVYTYMSLCIYIYIGVVYLIVLLMLLMKVCNKWRPKCRMPGCGYVLFQVTNTHRLNTMVQG